MAGSSATRFADRCRSRPARVLRQGAWRQAPLAAIALLAAACGEVPTRAVEDAARAEPGQSQRRSLETIFYRGNPLPPMPAAAEMAAAAREVAAAAPWERELLRSMYPADPESWALALRDTDGDGVRDFRVSDYYGRWLEGDTDIDEP